MSYKWGTVLAPDEKVQKEFGISLRYRHAVVVVIILISGLCMTQNFYGGLIVLIAGALYILYLTIGKHFAFTDKRVILVESFLIREIVSVDYNQITDIEVGQNAIDLIGGWGTITINTAGTHAPEINISFVENPVSVKQSLDQIRDSNKK